jgi:hypothetical protein
VKDPHVLLHQKEQDAERVRQEIQALRAVIPLLEDDEPLSDNLVSQKLSRDGMADLETYYPFVRHMRVPERS